MCVLDSIPLKFNSGMSIFFLFFFLRNQWIVFYIWSGEITKCQALRATKHRMLEIGVIAHDLKGHITNHESLTHCNPRLYQKSENAVILTYGKSQDFQFLQAISYPENAIFLPPPVCVSVLILCISHWLLSRVTLASTEIKFGEPWFNISRA